MTMRSLVILGATCALVFAPEAQARKRTVVRPYLEIDQTVFADLKNGSKLEASASAIAGVDATISGEKSEAQVSLRYEHRFGETRNARDADIFSGLARGRYTFVPDLVQFDAGALATRTRTDIRGNASNLGLANADNVSQLYSFYAGPTVATKVGSLDVGALYRFGYTKVDTKIRGALQPGQAQLGTFDDSTSHVASAYVGMGTGVLPFAWRVTGTYEREDAGQLAQRFESKTIRGDVTVPVTPTVALVGGAGYETIKSSARDAVRVNGVAQVDGNGRFITDPTSPRVLGFNSDGFIWDVGVLWKPSSRTSLEARVGQRYGSMIYTGSFGYQPTEDMAFSVDVYDGIQTFGRQVNGALAALPTQFTVARDPFGGQVNGCVFGASGGAAGGCLSGVLQSLANGTYRSRGINGVVRYSRGPWNYGLGVGYAQRRFYTPGGALAAANGVIDSSAYGQVFVGRRLDDRSGIDASAYINWYNSGQANAAEVLGTGANATYYRTFGRRFSANASLGIFSTRIEGVSSSLTGAGQVGARYTF
jgi:hypothetical protein